MSTIRLRPLTAGVPRQDRLVAGGRGRRRAWTIAISVLLHVAVLAGLLLASRRDRDEQGSGPSYELVFEGPQTAAGSTSPAADAPRESAATPAPPVPDTLPGPEAVPLAPPVAEAPPLPPAPADPAPAAAAPAGATEAAVAPAPSPDVQVTPEAAPLPSRPPAVRLEMPRLEALPPPLVPELLLPVPPVPRLPSAPPRPRSAPPAAPPGTFANPMDLSFHSAQPRLAAPRSTAPRGSVASRSLDLSPGTPKGPNRSDVNFDYRAAKLGNDWRDGLMSYWLNHRYFPRQAAELGEDGSADVELTVDASGRVTSAVLKSRTGSQFLDMAALSTWRGARLNPLPPELAPSYTFTITINYILLR